MVAATTRRTYDEIENDGGTNADASADIGFRRGNLLKGQYILWHNRRRLTIATFQIKTTKVNRKGKIKISGSITTLDGKKKTIRSKTVDVSDGTAYMEFSISKFCYWGEIWIDKDGLYGDCDLGEIYEAEVGGDLERSPATFYVENNDYWCDETYDKINDFAYAIRSKNPRKSACCDFSEAIMLEESITTVNGKWKVGTSNGKTNTSRLKLTYSKKTGIFKGTYRVYVVDCYGKTSYLTIKVSGIVLDGKGFGVASYTGVSETVRVYIE